MLTEERRIQFDKAVAETKVRTDGAKHDRPMLVAGLLLMAVGVVGTFVEYNVSLSQDDARDIASTQILVVALVCVTLIGTGLFVSASVIRVLRLWLLRQLVESQSRADQLAALVSAQQERR